jgi:hypothetical protein
MLCPNIDSRAKQVDLQIHGTIHSLQQLARVGTRVLGIPANMLLSQTEEFTQRPSIVACINFDCRSYGPVARVFQFRRTSFTQWVCVGRFAFLFMTEALILGVPPLS